MRWGIFSALIAVLLALPASALAAPGNDDFANRQLVSGALPIEVAGSNVEATKEEGEFIPGLAPAGHSVWFEWEAEADGWVTIGACDDEFPTVLAVFTGTAVNALTVVAEGNGSEGPDCPFSGRQFSFEAEAGTKYEIAVDGNGFHLPESPPPVTEGAIALRIEETPLPSNDDFADAATLTGSISEEPGGRRFFFTNTRGFNWKATTEEGEPEADTTGASVWYSFTAPEDAEYHFGAPCCQSAFFLHRDLYTGDALDQLTPLAVGVEFPEIELAAGDTVRIRISGPRDSETDEPAVANFGFNVTAELAPLPPATPGGGENPPAPPLPAPETAITKSAFNQHTRIARFRFSSTVEGSAFQCKLDKGAFKPCTSPKAYKHLKPGRHAFRVRALAPSGLLDESAAVGRFSIAAPQRRR
ncbi:MAG TPA: hypothetical protein VEP91_03990 [Solirubrobacterales bacterium]|nr:hypothetical protein [Solirubrobacterales bacterium]